MNILLENCLIGLNIKTYNELKWFNKYNIEDYKYNIESSNLNNENKTKDKFIELYDNGWLNKLYNISNNICNYNFLTGIFIIRYVLYKKINLEFPFNGMYIGEDNISLIEGMKYILSQHKIDNINNYINCKIIDNKYKNDFTNIHIIENIKNNIENKLDFYISDINLDNKYIYYHFYIIIKSIKHNSFCLLRMNFDKNILKSHLINILILISQYIKNIYIFKSPWCKKPKYYLFIYNKYNDINNIDYLRLKTFVYELNKLNSLDSLDSLDKLNITSNLSNLSNLNEINLFVNDNNIKLNLEYFNKKFDKLFYNDLFKLDDFNNENANELIYNLLEI